MSKYRVTANDEQERIERMLVEQANRLDFLFHELVGDAARAENAQQATAGLLLALKAQAQAHVTLRTLAEFNATRPRSIQIVRDETVPGFDNPRAEKEREYVKRLDAGAKGPTRGSD